MANHKEYLYTYVYSVACWQI